MNLGTFHGIFNSIGDLGSNPTQGGVMSQFESIISLTLGVLTVSAGIWFIFQIFAGALQWLGSGGEKQALQNAQKRIVNAVIGLLVVVMSYTFIAIISTLFGLYILSPFQALNGFAPPNVSNGSNPPPCGIGPHSVDCP